jgi:hypothetical protein
MASSTSHETTAQTAALPYPSSPAVGRLAFTGVAGAAEARVLAVLPPVRDGHGRRLRLHVAKPLRPGERLRDLQLQVEGADRLGLGKTLKVISVRPLVPARAKGRRGGRIRRALRRWDAARQRAAATGKPAPAKPKDRRRGKAAAKTTKAGTKPTPRAKRTPTGWSVVVEV